MVFCNRWGPLILSVIVEKGLLQFESSRSELQLALFFSSTDSESISVSENERCLNSRLHLILFATLFNPKLFFSELKNFIDEFKDFSSKKGLLSNLLMLMEVKDDFCNSFLSVVFVTHKDFVVSLDNSLRKGFVKDLIVVCSDGTSSELFFSDVKNRLKFGFDKTVEENISLVEQSEKGIGSNNDSG